jgi:hypothetical protein
VITSLTADKRQALDLVTAQIDKQFGTGAIMRFGEAMLGAAIETIPTGSIALDLALGVGASRVAASARSLDPSPPARPRCASTSWPKRRSWAAPSRTSTSSMLLTCRMPKPAG